MNKFPKLKFPLDKAGAPEVVKKAHNKLRDVHDLPIDPKNPVDGLKKELTPPKVEENP